MKLRFLILTSVTFATFSLATPLTAGELDGSDVQRDFRERRERVLKLSLDEQLKIRAAEQKAAEDPEVKAAVAKRNKAIEEFRMARRAAMIKADPSVAAILEKITAGPNRGY